MKANYARYRPLAADSFGCEGCHGAEVAYVVTLEPGTPNFRQRLYCYTCTAQVALAELDAAGLAQGIADLVRLANGRAATVEVGS